jgi:hypothetical protein
LGDILNRGLGMAFHNWATPKGCISDAYHPSYTNPVRSCNEIWKALSDEKFNAGAEFAEKTVTGCQITLDRGQQV